MTSQFTYDDLTFKVCCPTLDADDAFAKAIDTACAALAAWDKDTHYIFFQLEFVNDKGHAIEFWDKLLEDSTRYPLAQKYLQACIDRLSRYKWLYEDDEAGLGWQVAYRVSLKDGCFLPFYAQLLGCWDMDHECNESECLDEIFEKHGWCEGIGEIIIARASKGCGQHGFEDLMRWEGFIREHNEPLERSSFFKRVVREVVKIYGTDVWGSVEDDASRVFGGMDREAIAVRRALEAEYEA